MAAEGEELDINTEVDESMAKEGEGATETDPDVVCLALAWCFLFVLTKLQELEEMKRRVSEMEEEARKLIELQSQVELGSSSGSIGVNKEEADLRSVYVGNVCKRVYSAPFMSFSVPWIKLSYLRSLQVDYGATPEELQAHFQSCGTINRITILCDKFTGHPKGYVHSSFKATFF
jgi:polyadenylate-binding protein 2